MVSVESVIIVNELNELLFVILMYRSFALLRMTTLRFVVILSGAKDLYEMVMDHISNNKIIYSLLTLDQ